MDLDIQVGFYPGRLVSFFGALSFPITDRFYSRSSNLDASHPKPLKTLRAELNEQERAKARDKDDAQKAKQVFATIRHAVRHRHHAIAFAPFFLFFLRMLCLSFGHFGGRMMMMRRLNGSRLICGREGRVGRTAGGKKVARRGCKS